MCTSPTLYWHIVSVVDGSEIKSGFSQGVSSSSDDVLIKDGIFMTSYNNFALLTKSISTLTNQLRIYSSDFL